jgi:hypothetical protein
MLSEYKQDSIRDLIKKSKDISNASSFLNKVLSDIKRELNVSDKYVKLHALLKLFFLYLHNNDIKWASFNTLEVLATGGLPGKRLGYEIAQIQFKNNPECLQLVPNLIRKDLQSQNNAIIISALNLFNNVANVGLSFELAKDIEKLLNINNDWIRKKIIVSLTRATEFFLKQDPSNQFWDTFMIKLISILQSKNLSNGVSICLITSIQRICKLFPEKCLTTIAALKDYFQVCTINWCTIKIVDIIGMLFQHEPKLTKKEVIIKAIAQKLAQTTSRSVEFQMVKLIITNFDKSEGSGNTIVNELFDNCEERLRKMLFSQQDNNLVILSLRMLKEFLCKRKLLTEDYLADILKILDMCNNSFIQMECIEIINLSANKSNYKSIVEHLIISNNKIRNKVINTIIDICSYDTYERLAGKESIKWFLNILFNIEASEISQETEQKIGYVIRDISQRIEELRSFIVEKSYELLSSLIGKLSVQLSEEKEKKHITFIDSSKLVTEYHSTKSSDNLITVLIFIVGEYSESSRDRLTFLLDIISTNKLIRDSYYIPILNCIFKLYLKLADKDEEILSRILKLADPSSFDIGEEKLEYLELSILVTNIFRSLPTDIESVRNSFFDVKLMPLHDKAQQMIPPPKDFDLTICFNINDEEIKNVGKKQIDRTENKDIDKVTIDKKLYTHNNL